MAQMMAVPQQQWQECAGAATPVAQEADGASTASAGRGSGQRATFGTQEVAGAAAAAEEGAAVIHSAGQGSAE